jgi:hypothetical protein
MIIILKVLIIGIFFFALYKFRTKVIYFLPVYLTMFNVIYGFYPSGSGFGTTRSVTMLIFVIYMVLTNKDILTSSKWTTVFLLYTTLLIPLSSNVQNSIIEYMDVFLSFMCLPIAYLYIRNVDDLKWLNLSMIGVATIFVINSLLSTIFNFGIDYYGGGSATGGFVASKLFGPALFIVLLPIIIPQLGKGMRIVTFVLAALTFIFLLLSMRRTSVFIPVFGYMLYFLISKRKFQFIVISTIFLTMLLVLFPFYKKVLERQFMARSDTFENPSIESEYRYKETFIIFKENFTNTKTIMIGRDIFNSPGNYNQGKWGARPLHIDYNLVLHGSGVIGLILYLLIFLDILIKFLKFKNTVPKDPYFDELVIIFKILIIMVMTVSLNGGIGQLSYRAVMFLYLGGLLGIFNKYYKHNLGIQNKYTEGSGRIYNP